jgi:hypothetical protein
MAPAGELHLAAAWGRRLRDLGDREGRPAGYPPGSGEPRRLRDLGSEGEARAQSKRVVDAVLKFYPFCLLFLEESGKPDHTSNRSF